MTMTLESREVFNTLGVFCHLYIVFEDNDNSEFVIRGGPDLLEGDWFPFNDSIACESGIPLVNSRDDRGLGGFRDPQVLDIGNRVDQDVWSIMVQLSISLDEQEFGYYPWQNSNSVVTTVLRAVDINYPNPLPNPFFDYAGVRTVLSFNYNLTGTEG